MCKSIATINKLHELTIKTNSLGNYSYKLYFNSIVFYYHTLFLKKSLYAFSISYICQLFKDIKYKQHL